ncbi:MAG: hypothetical protein JW814_06690 [Candidatus Krumholzibacteriota bacterium]|nr:hypothetical protein [Candidatus Krumholzibacteriota bacterium]
MLVKKGFKNIPVMIPFFWISIMLFVILNFPGITVGQISIENEISDRSRDNSYVLIADSCLMADDFNCAVEMLKKASKIEKEESVRANIQWQIAGIYGLLAKDYPAAAREYKKFIDDYPDNKMVEQANYMLGKLFFNLRDPKNSAEYLSRITPGSPYYKETRQLLDWLDEHWKYEIYNNAKNIMIGISFLEILFVVSWILLGNIHQLSEIIRKPGFIVLFVLVLVFLAIKLYFNFMLYDLLQGLTP